MDSTEQKLDRIRKLIALSASSHVEEARTSAFMACKLIREHGFTVGPTSQSSSRTAHTTPRSEPPPPQPPPKSKYEKHPEWIRMTAKYAGFCKVCRKTVDEGSPIFWKLGEGSQHEACYLTNKPKGKR